MNISRSEAEAALLEIEQAAARTHTQHRYRIGAPILILWGAIWIVGYTVTGLAPGGWSGLAWLPLDLLGFAGTFMLVRRGLAATGSASGRANSWRSLLQSLAILFMVLTTFAMFKPGSAAVYLAYPGLMCGFAYMMFGIVRMPRLAVIGVAMSGLTLIGFFYAGDILAFWMAGVGGGGLILGGLWLKRL